MITGFERTVFSNVDGYDAGYFMIGCSYYCWSLIKGVYCFTDLMGDEIELRDSTVETLMNLI